MPRPEIEAEGVGPPPLSLLLLEGQRAFLESLTLAPTSAWLQRAPSGDGHPVLVLPGFTASDSSTRILRRFLKDWGYKAHPWLQGRNLGPRGPLREKLAERVDELFRRYDQPLSLIGWSLGGIYAREIAKQMPVHVRQVITLGSPFGDAGRASNASRLYEMFTGPGARTERANTADELRVPPSMPSTAIFTKTDGIVHWSTCLEPETDHTENIEVPGSHCGLGFNPLVLFAISDRLRQAAGSWQPFDRSGWRRHVYR